MPELRITTGTAKNKRLKAPEIPGFRAVQEVAKSSIFSILGEDVVGSVCLDLFAGSGNLGLEALSRGATWCDFVDANRESVAAIKENIKNCGFEDKSTVFWKEAVKYIKKCEKKYDLIFMDPFYDDFKQKHLFSIISGLLDNTGVMVYFHNTSTKIEGIIDTAQYDLEPTRSFGTGAFTILRIR